MESMNIRLVEAEDYMDIAMLNVQSGYEYPPHKVKERIEYILSCTKDKIIVVENSEKRVIGFIHGVPQYSLNMDNLVIIESLVVEPGYRRKGIAKRLVQILENWARDNGYSGAHLATSRDRPAARGFYENIGYFSRENQSNFVKYFTSLQAS